MQKNKDYITTHLFRDIAQHEFLLPWPQFVDALSKYLCKLKTITTTIGTSKVINSVIGRNVFIGDFTLIRNSIIEPGAKIGAHVQVNMSVIREGVELPHFNNVGYSFLGKNVLLGSGTTTTSRRLDDNYPSIKLPNGEILDAYTRKFGALIGDECRIGSHVCMNPFTIIEMGTIIYPGKSISGYVCNVS